MEKKYLQENILSAPYNRSVWHDVLKDLFSIPRLLIEPTPIHLAANEIAESAVELGSFFTADERMVGVYEIVLKGDAKTKLAVNKVGLRNLLRSIYKYDVDAALIVFVQGEKWRFSYVSEIRTEEGKKETEPKRYTYLFGTGESCRTAAERFYNLQGKRIFLQDLFDGFSVEKLNQDFFKYYNDYYKRGVAHLVSNKQYYSWLVDGKKEAEEKRQKPIRDYVKKMMGRIVFLHFLQKKGWMGVPERNKIWEGGDKQFMQTLFKKYPNQEHFNSKCLRYLFFETLNTDRDTNDDLAPQSLLQGRKEKFKVPYLNGGLFEKSEADEFIIDFPTEYFASLFDFFEQYNFTIDENDPYESEVGIDPEMLGHIFENLLEENRERGTFYTPKEIVYFMCHESLIEYLATQISDASREDIELLVRHNRVAEKFTKRAKAQEINEKLINLKLCDPAIGSGAFPMGMLKEIFECRRLIYPYLNTTESFNPAGVKKEIIENNIYGVDLEAGAVDIARLRFWLALVVDEVKPHPLPNLDYKIMQGNSLLESFEGIELGNVTKPNIKIVGPAKDLFGNMKEEQLTLTYSKSETVNEIQKLMRKFFRLENAKEKQEARAKINAYVHEHLLFNLELRQQQLERWIGEIEDSENKNAKQEKKLIEYSEQLQKLNASQKRLEEIERTNDKPFFLWHVYFNDVFKEGGFDIVIGNPPYIQLQKMGSEADALQAAGFKTFTRTGDVYCLFYEQAHKILKSRGNLIFITGSAWLRSNYGKELRKFFLDSTNPLQLIDLSDCQIFQSATVLTTIMQYKKEKNTNQLKSLRLTRKSQQYVYHLSSYLKENYSLLQNLGETAWTINDREKAEIKKEVIAQGKSLTNWEVLINRGIVTGYNPAFIINSDTRNKLIAADIKNEAIIKPLLRGKDLSRYTFNFHELWLLYIPWHFPLHEDDSIVGASKLAEIAFKKEYAALYKHLEIFKEGLSDRNKDETGIGYEWYALQRFGSKFWKEFEKPKIIYPNMVMDISFTYDDKGYYTNQKCFILTGEKLKYLVGVLNSKLFRYCFEEDFPELQGNTREINKVIFEKIPVKYPNSIEEKVVEFLVNYLLFLYNRENKPLLGHTPNNRIANTIEEVLNMVVYELYFSRYMKENNLNVIEFLEVTAMLDVPPTPEVILAFYMWLQQPMNKIRNRIIAVDIKSPDFLSRINSTTR